MPQQLVNLGRIKRACALVMAGERRGTAYLVTREVAVTCEHVVREAGEGASVSLTFADGVSEATAEYLDRASDFAILRLKEPKAETEPLPIGTGCAPDDGWSAYGFPLLTGTVGIPLSGTVRDPDGADLRGKQAIVLFSPEIAAAKGGPAAGFSGTPVIVRGAVVGHLMLQIPDDGGLVERAELGLLFACPVARIQGRLPAGYVMEATSVETPPAEFNVPFARNGDFVGRDTDLSALHALLSPGGGRARRLVLSGMGGVGKTQLAVEYAYRHRESYPEGVFWVDGTQPLTSGFQQIARQLAPANDKLSPEQQVTEAFKELGKRTAALLVFDNLTDLARLNDAVGVNLVPAALPCRLLITSRTTDAGAAAQLHVSVLAEPAALEVLLRHPARARAADPADPDYPAARSVCKALGYLPLALELAGAFLAEWPEVSLGDYLRRLQEDGCLTTLDREVGDLPPAQLAAVHRAGLTATLRSQWSAIKDETDRLLFRVCGLVPEVLSIPAARLGLLAGVEDRPRPGDPGLLRRAIRRLERASLVLGLPDQSVRIHPLVREFALGLTPEGERPAFGRGCAENLAVALQDVTRLQEEVGARGATSVQTDIWTALDLARGRAGHENARAGRSGTQPVGTAPAGMIPDRSPHGSEGKNSVDLLHDLIDVLQREAHHLRGWVPAQLPAFFLQQFENCASRIGHADLAKRAAEALIRMDLPYLRRVWAAGGEPAELVRVLRGGDQEIRAVALLPSGRECVTASKDGVVRVWDLRTGETVRLIQTVPRPHSLMDMALTPDGRHVAVARMPPGVDLWSLETGELEQTLQGVECWPYAVRISETGTRLVVAGNSDSLFVVDLPSGGPARSIPGRGFGDVYRMDLGADGRTAVTGSFGGSEGVGTVGVWDIVDGEVRGGFRAHSGQVSAVALSPDQSEVASGGIDLVLRFWDIEPAPGFRSGLALQLEPRALRFIDGGKGLLAAAGGTLLFVDVTRASVTRRLQGHQLSVQCLALERSEQYLLSGSGDGSIGFWDLWRTGSDRPGAHQTMISSADVGLQSAVAGSIDGVLSVWDVRTGTARRVNGLPDCEITRVALSGDESSLVAAVNTSDGAQLLIVQLESGDLVRRVELGNSKVSFLAVGPEGLIVTMDEDNNTHLLDVRAAGPLSLPPGLGDAEFVAVSANAQFAAYRSGPEEISVARLPTGESLGHPVKADASGQLSRLTPDGRWLLTTWREDTLLLLDFAAGAVVRRIERCGAGPGTIEVRPDDGASEGDWWAALDRVDPNGLMNIGLSPDGRIALAAFFNGMLRVFSLGDGKLVASGAVAGWPTAVGFSPDGKTIVVGDGGGALYLFRMEGPAAPAVLP